MARRQTRHGQPPTASRRHFDIITAAGQGFVDRFHSKINTRGPAAACGGRCHQWTGTAITTACEAPSEWYGKIGASVGGRCATLRVHRVAWMLTHGQAPPDDRWVLHKCHNRMCVNPDHLYLGTHGDNMRDLAVKRKSGAPEIPDRAAKRRRPFREIGEDDKRRIAANISSGASKRSQMRLFNASKLAVYAIVSDYAPTPFFQAPSAAAGTDCGP